MSGDGSGGPFRPLDRLLDAWAQGAQLAADGTQTMRPPQCGGALLRLARDEARDVVAGRVRFEVDDPSVMLPEEGRGDIRVRCRGEVETRTFKPPTFEGQEPNKNAKGHAVTYGLCERCSGLEKKNRMILRNELAKQKTLHPTKRGFNEDAK